MSHSPTTPHAEPQDPAERALDGLRAALAEHQGDLVSLAKRLAERQRELEAALHERDLLLQELHHRVKGNLQTISSLLSLQLRTLSDPSAKDAIEDSRARVRAISLLHERLHQSQDAANVDMRSYLLGLASEVKRAFAGRPAPVSLDVTAEPLHLEMDRAVACGLVAHELVRNAIEHGTGPDGTAAVALSLGRQDEEAVLTVADRGPGLGDVKSERGLGLELVRALGSQLRGSIRFEHKGGLVCQLRFPLTGSAKPSGG